MTAARLYLVRHGQSEGNRAQQLVSFTDHRLTAEGEAQARHLGLELRAAGIGFDVAVASPLIRARRTAELVLAELADPPALTVDERLLETHFGRFEGRTFAEMDADVEAAAWWRDGAAHPAVEPDETVASRMAAAMADLPPAGRTLVVGHGRSLLVLLATWVLGLPPAGSRRLRMGHCRPAVVEHGPPRVLVGLNTGGLE